MLDNVRPCPRPFDRPTLTFCAFSIAVEPLYPQVCQKEPVYHDCVTSPSPIELSRALNSITCPLSVRREDPFSIYHLIMQARHHMSCVWNTVQFWLCCCVTVTLIQLLCTVLMLPPVLRTGHVLWLTFLVIPLLSVSLLGLRTDDGVMKKPLGKSHNRVNGEVLLFILWCYGVKFLPVIFAVVLTYAAALACYCRDICQYGECACTGLFFPTPQSVNGTANNVAYTWGGWSQYDFTLFSAQHLALLLIVLHFLVLSITFVNRDHNIWSRCPINNIIWVCIANVLVILHSLYSSVSLIVEYKEEQRGFESMSCYLFVFVFGSPLITFAIAEFVKYREIKANLRYQRRARLDFGTKLGMNSPF